MGSIVLFNSQRNFLVLCVVLAITAGLFAEVVQYGFVNLDDPYLVQSNASLLKPLSWQTLFAPVAGLYHPLTNFTYWVDARIAGLNPWIFHLSNLLFHLFGVAGIFLLSQQLSQSVWVAGVLAAAFAWHPTHVESFAWISERKDVVSVAFFWWALYAHLRERKSITLILASLSLLAKPFALMLPIVVLGVEYTRRDSVADLKIWIKQNRTYIFSLVTLSLIAAIAAVLAQDEVRQSEVLSLIQRLERTPGQLLFYFNKTIWPVNLKLLYSTEDLRPNSTALVIVVFAIFASVGQAWRSAIFRRDLFLGLTFFAVTIIPMLKIIPFGDHTPVADRYLYVSQSGLLWPWARLLATQGSWRWILRLLWLLMLSFWASGSWLRLADWESSLTMWESLLRAEPGSRHAHENLGRYFIGLERPDKALEHLRLGLTDTADNAQNQAFALLRLGRKMEADKPLTMAEEKAPGDPKIINLRGNWYLDQGDFKNAELYFRRSLAASPKLLTELVRAEALTNLGVLAYRKGEFSKCLSWQNQALSSLPAYAYAYHNRALCLLKLKRNDEAQRDYETTLRIAPSFAMAHNGLGVLALTRGNLAAAERHFVDAINADPNLELARTNLALVRRQKANRQIK